MKKKQLHPAIEAASNKAKQRYIIFGVCFVLAAVLFGLSFLVKPGETLQTAEKFSESSATDTYVTAELTITSAMFEQDDLDDEGNAIGTNYYALAIDSDLNRFMLKAPKEYYIEKIQSLEDNSVYNFTDDTYEVLDPSKTITVYGYSIEMSGNLKKALSDSDNEYNQSILSVVYPNVFEIVEEPLTVKKSNSLLIAAAVVGIFSLLILLTAVSASAELARVKEKHADKKSASVSKKKKAEPKKSKIKEVEYTEGKKAEEEITEETEVLTPEAENETEILTEEAVAEAEVLAEEAEGKSEVLTQETEEKNEE